MIAVNIGNILFMKKMIIAALLLTMSITGYAKQYKKLIAADNPNIQYTGRFSFKNKKAPCMVYPGSQIETSFSGSYIGMMAKPGSGYFMVTIDNDNPIKIYFSAKDSVRTLVRGLNNGKHNCKVMLAYEGYQTRPEFRGFLIDRDAKLLPTPNTKRLKLEFIGNSITCGYGIEARDKMIHYSDSTENHYYTYAATAARELNAESMVVARSGIGVYRNYNGPKSGDKDIMPRWYDYTLLYDSTEVWNSKRYTPDIVCVNLGTNDLSTDNYDITLYKNSYMAFMKHLRSIYPKAKIVMLTGCMLSGSPLKQQKQALDAVKEELGDKLFYRFDFTPANGSLGYGADYHPSMLQARKMATELVGFINSIR